MSGKMAKSNIFKRIIKYLSDPEYRFNVNKRKFGCYNNLSDEEYIKKHYKAVFGYELDLDNPKTFNEKLQWLKLYDRKPLYTKLVDKYLVREYVKEKIGEEYLIPLLAVYERAEDIDFDALPNEFVLKCNHNSGGLFICKDKSKLTPEKIAEVRKKLNNSLKYDFYLYSREWPYKDVPRKIIAEKYMEDESEKELKDYKFYTFGGKVKAILMICGRFESDRTGYDYFDENCQRIIGLKWGKQNSKCEVKLPERIKEMIPLAEKLAEGFPQVRVDLYLANGRIYFGEMTFFDGGGFQKFEPEKWDRIFGDWIVLPEKDKRL